MALTAVIAPLKLRPLWHWYFIYTVAAAALWIVFTFASILFWPEPGIGVCLLGFLSWIIGTIIYVQRILARLGK